jgi:hypothetical protein
VADLETVDLEGVEILSTGGPVFAIGSPPEGDHYTTEQLRSMVVAANELGDELDAPSRIGHRKMGESQADALRSSPAVGWLANHRLNADGTKYLADIKRVPKAFAELLRAGAWRKRSAELSSITSQKTKKSYENVVTGVAWLGDRMPAITTLEDVMKLYEGDAERKTIVVFENDPPKDGFAETLLERLTEKLLDEVAAGSGDRSADTRHVKFSEKQRKSFAEATGLEADKVTDDMLAAAGVVTEAPAPIVSDEPAQELAKIAGVEGDELTADKLMEALKKRHEGEGGDGGEGGEGGDEGKEAERYKELERRLEAAEKTSKDTAEELRVERRNAFIETVVKEGKIAPGAREKLERLFDKDPEGAREFVSELKPDEELVREHGSDGPTPEETTEQEKLEKAYEADLASRLGTKVEELI